MISSTLLCTALIHCITGLLAFRFTWSTFRRANLGLRYLYVSAATVELSLLVLMVFQTLSTDLTRIIKYELVIITIFASVMIPMGLGFLGGQKSLARKALISLSIIFLYNLVSVYLAAWVAHVPIWSFKMSHHISRTAITGVIISSSLAGYGSIEFPLKYWELLFSYVSYSSISDVKNRLIAVVDERNHVANQMETIRRIYKLPKSDDFQRGFSSPLIDSNAISSFYDEEHDTVASTRSQRRLSLTDIHVLRQEFQTLENLATDLTLSMRFVLSNRISLSSRYHDDHACEVHEIADDQRQILESSGLGDGNRLYLQSKRLREKMYVVQVFTAVINVVFQRVAAVDPVTVFLENILGTMKVGRCRLEKTNFLRWNWISPLGLLI